ncbi:TetR/AcrR family transcriptional regulator [Leucobacter celer]|uniref:TetR/AcrR family transcriptional regulator n=1 Tax=Leucobacter celer TaxID=668625 RepID=UPI0006A7C0AF|nr:TetR/AcrR family transcriptional regulator [Leucobacter celer]
MAYIDATIRSSQIVAAAREVMVRDSVPRTTIRAVAAEAGIPLGTLQHVFPTKELLVQAVMEDVAAETIQQAGSLPAGAGVAETIRLGARAYWAGLVADSLPEQVMQIELLSHTYRTPGSRASARWPFGEQAAALASILETVAQRSGEICQTSLERIARVFIAGLDGLMLQYMSDENRVRAEEDLEALIEAMIGYARIRPAVPADA